MELVEPHTAESYLRRTGRVPATAKVAIQRLGGGVSNEVLLVTVDEGDRSARRFVLKQARSQLRTPQPWFCTVERIWRETAVLAICERLASGQVPELLFEDRPNYLFAMSAAPADHRTWKQDLLAGVFDEQVAQATGALLARLHGGSWRDPEVAEHLSDRAIFADLRLDPYYRAVAERVPEASAALARATESLEAHARSLVHADFSPKNILLASTGLLLVDHETGHYGDPAFDLGFCLSHLVLKGVYFAPRHAPLLGLAERFWSAYRETLEPRIDADEWHSLSRRWPQHWGACLWARIDGKSQVEYLPDPARREVARSIARDLLLRPAMSWEQAMDFVTKQLDKARI